MESQIIYSVCKAVYHMIYNLRRICKYFDQDSTKTVVHACITSKLDYCNSLLYGLPDSHIVKLQQVQNTYMCKIDLYSPKICPYYTPVNLLRELHWLPICQRIEFKILIVYKVLNSQAPSYIIKPMVIISVVHRHIGINCRSPKLEQK